MSIFILFISARVLFEGNYMAGKLDDFTSSLITILLLINKGSVYELWE